MRRAYEHKVSRARPCLHGQALGSHRAQGAQLALALGCDLRAMAAEGLPVEVWPSAANFVLVRTPHATRVRERLRDEYSILVRDFSYAPGLADCLRITVGTPQENDEVLAAFAVLVKEEI